VAVTITRVLADTYFETRIDAELWVSFNAGLRDKAIVSASDVISRALGDTITDETVEEDAQYYPDRAVYHQALYMLSFSNHTANGQMTGFKFSGTTPNGESKDVSGKTISKESLYWMNWRNGATIRIAKG